MPSGSASTGSSSTRHTMPLWGCCRRARRTLPWARKSPGADGRAGDVHSMVEVVISGWSVRTPPGSTSGRRRRRCWRPAGRSGDDRRDRRAPQRPRRFTTLNGFEWTPTPGGVNFHRVIIFRGNDVPDLPLSNYEASHPTALGLAGDRRRRPGQRPGDHPQRELQQRPDVQSALQRRAGDRRGLCPSTRPLGAARRDVPEQGSSEMMPDSLRRTLSPTSRSSRPQAFQQVSGSSSDFDGPAALGQRPRGRPGGPPPAGTWRQPVPDRLRQRQRWSLGHPGQQRGEGLVGERVPRRLREFRLHGVIEGGLPSVLLNPAGLTGARATETRAMRCSTASADVRRSRRAACGSPPGCSAGGPWRRPTSATSSRPATERAYRWEPSCRTDRRAPAPTLLVHAAKDALGANLDRIQVVKCWTARGILFEKVFEAAASDGRTPDPRTGHCRPLPSTVDVAAATDRNDNGATELSAPWTVPRSIRRSPAPTTREPSRSRRRGGRPMTRSSTGCRSRRAVPAAVQQRAWTPPIWYTPRSRTVPSGRGDGMFTVAQLADRGSCR